MKKKSSLVKGCLNMILIFVSDSWYRLYPAFAQTSETYYKKCHLFNLLVVANGAQPKLQIKDK